MFPCKLSNLMIAALCFCVVLTSFPVAAYSQKKTAPVETTPPPVNEDFKFGDVDLEILEQSDLVDKQFERNGLVLSDVAGNAFLNRIGH